MRVHKIFHYTILFLATSFLIWAGHLWASGPHAAILMYHSVGEALAPRSSLSITGEEFSRQMAFFKRNGYRVVPLRELVDKIRQGEEVAPKTIALTFDDGYADNYTLAFPVLKEYGFPATVFVITDLIGREVTLGGRPVSFLTAGMMREMADSGLIDFGVHSATGASLPGLEGDPQALRREVEDPRRFLEGLLGRPVSFFSFPFGAYNRAVQQCVRDAGYAAAVTTYTKKGYIHDDLFALKRVKIKGEENPLQLFFKTSGFYLRMKEMNK